MKRSIRALEVLGSHVVNPGKKPRLGNNRNDGPEFGFKDKLLKTINLKSAKLKDILTITRKEFPHLEVLNLEHFEGLRTIFGSKNADKGMELLSAFKAKIKDLELKVLILPEELLDIKDLIENHDPLIPDTTIIFGHKYKDDICSICQDNLENGEDIIQLPCRHMFHQKCINKWEQQNEHNAEETALVYEHGPIFDVKPKRCPYCNQEYLYSTKIKGKNRRRFKIPKRPKKRGGGKSKKSKLNKKKKQSKRRKTQHKRKTRKTRR